MMMRFLAVMLCCLAAASHGQAVDWDHDANLAQAVTTLVEAYGAGGLPQAENIAQECQQSVAEIQDQIQRLMRFEYCAGLNFAGFLINRRDIEETGAAASEYFTAQRVNERMERLNEYIDAPGVPHQVLRAWGRSVANELDRKLK